MSNWSGNTIGEILKNAREKKKLSLQQVNQETKMSMEVLHALEGDDLGSFESETYLKGFLKTYATFLGLDAVKLWDLYRRGKSDASGTPDAVWDTEGTLREEHLRSPRLFRRFVLPFLLLVIVVLVVLLVRQTQRVKKLTIGCNPHHIEVDAHECKTVCVTLSSRRVACGKVQDRIQL